MSAMSSILVDLFGTDFHSDELAVVIEGHQSALRLQFSTVRPWKR